MSEYGCAQLLVEKLGVWGREVGSRDEFSVDLNASVSTA